MTSTDRANWTIAYRKRTANRFLRVSTWAGTWSQAVGMARLFGAANPDLEVYYTSNRAAEVEGFVVEEDCRNILVDSGRRVRIVETDVELPAEMIARIPVAEVARERWNDGDEIADAEGAEPTGPKGTDMTSSDTFPRNCEMTRGMMRIGYSHVERAHDAAIVEQMRRNGEISDDSAVALTARIEGHAYSEGPFSL